MSGTFRTNELLSKLDRRLNAKLCDIEQALIGGNENFLAAPTLRANVDNAGRQEVSQNIALGEYNLDNDDLPLFFSQTNIDGGTQGYNTTDNGQDLIVTSDGDGAVYQSKQWHPYFPGHAQQAEFTFIGFTPETDVVKRVGYYSASTTLPFEDTQDGFYLESSGGIVSLRIAKGGTIVTINQEDWLDPLDGTGPSGVTIDWDNFNVFLIDFLYLGGTSVNLYHITEGGRNLIHRYNHSNQFPTVIVDSPAQPLRAEIRSTGGAGSFTFVCAQVSTAGVSGEFSGTPSTVDTGDALLAVATAGTEYAILGIRKESANVEVFIRDLSVILAGGPTESFTWRLHINPTLSADLAWTDIDGVDVERGVGNGSQTITADGHIIASGVGASRTDFSSSDLSKALRIGMDIQGEFDELILSFVPHQNSQNPAAAINFVVI